MPENIFSPKMRGKSVNQLKEIIDSKAYTPEAKEAASRELSERGETDFDAPEKAPVPKLSGEELYKDFLKTIKKKRSWSLTPKYHERFQADLSTRVTIGLAVEVFEKLQWEVIHRDEEGVIALRPQENLMSPKGERVSVSTEDKRSVKIESKSTGQEIFDMGRNSIRVKLFIHVFNEIRASKTDEELSQLEEDLVKAENWDDYEIPENLPLPKEVMGMNPIFFYLIVSLSTLLLSFVFALTVLQVHVVILFESLVGWTLSFVIVQSLKITNYTDFKSIRLIVILATVTIIFGSQYFQYQIILHQNPELSVLSFYQFAKAKLLQGFTFESMNLGWYGWVGLFVLQYLIIYYLNMLLAFSGLIKYIKERVPAEVVDFTSYHIVKGKNEHEIRAELSMKGWSEKQHQDYVFEAIGAMQEGSNFVKHS